MLENHGLSLKGNVENISSMANISIMLKTYGKTRAQHAILEDWPSPKRKERGDGGAGKHLQTPRSDSVTFPVQRRAERSQKEYPSGIPSHVEKPPSLGNKTLSTNPVL